MDRFNPPPNWPPVPEGWTPPKDWRPGPELPPPPKGWPLWVNDKGKAAAGPSGHYGAMTAGKTAAILGAVALAACCGCGGFGAFMTDDEPDAEPQRLVSTSTTTTTKTATKTAPPTRTPARPTATKTRTVTSTATKAPKPKTAEPTRQRTATPAPTTTRTPTSTTTQAPAPEPSQPAAPAGGYENCDAARAAGAAPVYRGSPGYAPHLDRDGDGVGCEG